MARRDGDEVSAFEQLMERMLEIQQQQAATMQQAEVRNRPKENPNYVVDSIFLKPENGEPWAADLKWDVYLNSIHLNKTPLTKAEVEALNTLQPCENVVIVKVDESKALGSVEPRLDAMGRIDRMTIRLPMKKDDNPQHYPGLVAIAKQFAAAAPVMAVA